MNGIELAQKVIEKYGTSDVFCIAEQADIKVIYEHWQPVTFGEFDKKDLAIRINLNAPIEKEQILAHELGHYFVYQFGFNLDKKEEEKIVGDFAKFIQTHCP